MGILSSTLSNKILSNRALGKKKSLPYLRVPGKTTQVVFYVKDTMCLTTDDFPLPASSKLTPEWTFIKCTGIQVYVSGY